MDAHVDPDDGNLIIHTTMGHLFLVVTELSLADDSTTVLVNPGAPGEVTCELPTSMECPREDCIHVCKKFPSSVQSRYMALYVSNAVLVALIYYLWLSLYGERGPDREYATNDIHKHVSDFYYGVISPFASISIRLLLASWQVVIPLDTLTFIDQRQIGSCITQHQHAAMVWLLDIPYHCLPHYHHILG